MRALPSLRQLRYLVALSEHLSFTRAAEACFITQSTLSAGLKELESLLGARLVERDRQSVLMTPIGTEAAERAKRLLAEAEDLVERAAVAGAPMSGTFRLGVIPTIAPFLLPGLLPDLRKRHPGLTLALREDLTARLLERLRAGALDAALIALPYDTAGLVEVPLFDDEFWLVGRADDPVLRARRAAVSASVAERLLLLEEGHCLREHTLSACAHGTRAGTGDIEATSLLTLVQMVESGIGLALIPELALKGGLLTNTQLLARPLEPPVPKRSVALVARTSSARHADVETLAGIVTASRRRFLGRSIARTKRNAS